MRILRPSVRLFLDSARNTPRQMQSSAARPPFRSSDAAGTAIESTAFSRTIVTQYRPQMRLEGPNESKSLQSGNVVDASHATRVVHDSVTRFSSTTNYRRLLLERSSRRDRESANSAPNRANRNNVVNVHLQPAFSQHTHFYAASVIIIIDARCMIIVIMTIRCGK